MRIEVQLYKAAVFDMPLLYFLKTPMGIICWEGRDRFWSSTRWPLDMKDLIEWVEKLQGGKLIESNKLQFLLETGMGLEQSLNEGIVCSKCNQCHG